MIGELTRHRRKLKRKPVAATARSTAVDAAIRALLGLGGDEDAERDSRRCLRRLAVCEQAALRRASGRAGRTAATPTGRAARTSLAWLDRRCRSRAVPASTTTPAVFLTEPNDEPLPAVRQVADHQGRRCRRTGSRWNPAAARPGGSERCVLRQRAARRSLPRRACAVLRGRRRGAARPTPPEGAAGALLDYDDLILRTPRSAADRRRRAWVLYKLDGGIDHLLIDEAQDTSPEQWRYRARADGRVLRRRRRAPAAAHGVRRRRRQAVDLQLPGRRTGGVPARTASASPRAVTDARRRLAADRPERSRSARPRRCWTRSTRCSPTPAMARASRSTTDRSSTRSWRQRGRRRSGRGLAAADRRGDRASPDAWDPAGRPGRATIRRRPRLARLIAAAHRARWCRTARRCRRAAGRSAPATSWCWCAAAPPSSRRWSAR